jgi:hypothetical protein
VPLAPPITTWAAPIDNSAQIAHATAVRQRGFKAAMGIGTSTTGTPQALAYDPAYLRQVMLNRIASLEETIRKLPPPLSEEVEGAKREVAKLKALPPPADVAQAPSKLKKFGEQVLSEVASAAVKEAAKELWAAYGHQLVDVARSAADWIASILS